MKWYNQNGLKILYDAEYSGDYLINKKYGLSYSTTEKIRGSNPYIEVDTANPDSPNSRIDCHTLEVFVVFEASDFEEYTDDHVLFGSGGDMQDDNQVGDLTMKWYLKDESSDSPYIFSYYPLILFNSTLQDSSDEYFPIAISFLKTSYWSYDASGYVTEPNLWIRIPVSDIHYSDGCFGGYDAFQIDGDDDSGCFIGRISEEEAQDYDFQEGTLYSQDIASHKNQGAEGGFDGSCNFKLAINPYRLTNKAYPEFPSNAKTFYGMTITITTEETHHDYWGDVMAIKVYCNGTQIFNSACWYNSGDNPGTITIPRYIVNQTISERYGDWNYADNKSNKLNQPLFVRAYDRRLTETEIQNNTDVDYQRFLGDMDMGWVNSTPPPEGFPQDSGGSGDLDW